MHSRKILVSTRNLQMVCTFETCGKVHLHRLAQESSLGRTPDF